MVTRNAAGEETYPRWPTGINWFTIVSNEGGISITGFIYHRPQSRNKIVITLS
jgi:hypothetical protein